MCCQGVVKLWNNVGGLDEVPGVDPALLNTVHLRDVICYVKLVIPL